MQKARIFISIIIICLIVSACASLSKSSIDVVGNTLHKRSNTSSEKENRVSDLKPVKYPQRKEKLPGIDTLTTFPGIFENMFLTLEQIITVLGNDFELRENLAQGYDTYIYNKYDMAIEFDRLRHKPSAIYLSGTPYYFNSGASEKKDLNGDGIPECIIIYEDVNYSGKILLVDGKTGKQCEKEFGYLGNKSSVEILTGLGEYKESVILIKTHGGKLADLFKYENENLIRILPDEYSRLAENTSVTVEANKAVVVNKNEDFLYLCPLPDRFSSFVKGKTAPVGHTLSINLFPEMINGSLELQVRTNIQVRLFDTYDYIAGTEGIFCDVAGITRKYRYTGNGKWQEIGLEATIKYEEHQSSAFSSSDFSIGGFVLNKSIKTLEPSLSNFFADFTSEELNNGVLIDNDGLLIGATQGEITYISLEDGDNATKLGLKLSDTKEKAIELYGIPDKGFVNDSTWTYYIYREEWSEGNLSVYIDSLNLEFCKDKVCRIWMVSYIAAY